MSKTTSTLYECRGCGGLVASKADLCPYCGHSEGPEREIASMRDKDETRTVTDPWYRVVDLEVGA